MRKGRIALATLTLALWALAAPSAWPTAPPGAYTVQPGDTFDAVYLRLARPAGVSYQDFRQANRHVADPDVLHPGDVLYIPAGLVPPGAGLTLVELRHAKESCVAPLAETVTVYAARVPPGQYRLGIASSPEGGGIGLDDVAANASLAACVNASFFDEDLRPVGLVIAEGREVSPLGMGASSGVFFERGAAYHIVRKHDFDPAGVTLAVQAYPLLVLGGRSLATGESEQCAPRTAVGVDASGAPWLAITEPSLLNGITLYEWAAVLSDPPSQGGLGLASALNLDGGSSVRLYVREDGLALGGGGKVANFLCAVEK